VLNDKLKWFRLFQKSYSGGCMEPDICELTNGSQRFILALENNQQLGFIQISNRENTTGVKGLWSVGIAYVKPEFRSKNVLKKLISHVVKAHGVGIIHIEEERYYKNHSYYKSLGFTHIELLDDGLSLIYLKKTIREVEKARLAKPRVKREAPTFMNFIHNQIPFQKKLTQPLKKYGV
jgi:hypothetical protein